MWMALKDKVLIILLIAAIISLVLGIYTTVGTPPVRRLFCRPLSSRAAPLTLFPSLAFYSRRNNSPTALPLMAAPSTSTSRTSTGSRESPSSSPSPSSSSSARSTTGRRRSSSPSSTRRRRTVVSRSSVLVRNRSSLSTCVFALSLSASTPGHPLTLRSLFSFDFAGGPRR